MGLPITSAKDSSVNAAQQSALKVAGSVFLVIAAFLALAFLSALWVSGVLWISEKIVWYVWTAANTVFWVCLIVMLPLSLFTATRKVSCFGILGTSFIFGLCTWILGFLATYEYWGGFGVFVGLVSGIVGIVPVGILASIFHADWMVATFLTIGLLLTYCARSFAIWLAIITDREVSVLPEPRSDLYSHVTSEPPYVASQACEVPHSEIVAARADTMSAKYRRTVSGSALAGVSLLPEDFEFENETQGPGQDAEQAQCSDWDVAATYYADLNEIHAGLRRTSSKLALAFRAILLETKQFSKGKELAQRLEDEFLRTYFGRNPKILGFARTLIAGGHKAPAKELNRAISVLGDGADENLIIERVRKGFDLAPVYAQSTKHKLAEALSRTVDLDLIAYGHASTLIKELGGSCKTWWSAGDVVVKMPTGERHHFSSRREMILWVKDTIIPQVLLSVPRAEDDQRQPDADANRLAYAR